MRQPAPNKIFHTRLHASLARARHVTAALLLRAILLTYWGTIHLLTRRKRTCRASGGAKLAWGSGAAGRGVGGAR